MVQVQQIQNRIQLLQPLLSPKVVHKTLESLVARISQLQSRTVGMIMVFVKVQVKNVMV